MRWAVNHEPFAVETEVVHEQGSWAVYLELWFDNGVRRQRVGDYSSEHAARTAARWIIWAARRDARPPDGLEPKDIG